MPFQAAGRAISKDDAAAGVFDDLAHDGEPQPAAFLGRTGDAVEALEHMVSLVHRNAGPVIGDRQHGFAVNGGQSHRDAAACPGVAQRIVDEIDNHLAQHGAVADDRHGAGLFEAEIDVAGDRRRRLRFQHVPRCFGQVDAVGARPPAARFGA